MKIYHGSLEIVEYPLIIKGNRRLDYGEGFYIRLRKNNPKTGLKGVC